MSAFNDGYTKKLEDRMDDFQNLIYEIEDNMESLEGNSAEIIKYLSDIRCSMPLGLALRRYLCGKFGTKKDDGTTEFNLGNKKITVKDYQKEDYDILNDDVKEYTDLCEYLNAKYNKDENAKLILPIKRAEFRRMLRVTGNCKRDKMIELGFALKMNADEVQKFLTDVLAEQTYNYRDPYEIIAYFCQSRPDINTYADFLRIKEKYLNLCNEKNVSPKIEEGYTEYAKLKIEMSNEQELCEFLVQNKKNFNKFSQTAYNEFMELLKKAMKKSGIQNLSNDDYLISKDAETTKKRAETIDRINNAIEIREVTNTEQLAKVMIGFIPRATIKKDGNKKSENDFINVYNGENNQNSNKKKTTTLPKDITTNILLKDRLDDLINEKKPVTRKDLVFLRFYNLNLELENSENFSSKTCFTFIDECNDMLSRCGMSDLYPANRFENLILMSLVSERPFEMFTDILSESFMNEPEYSDDKE